MPNVTILKGRNTWHWGQWIKDGHGNDMSPMRCLVCKWHDAKQLQVIVIAEWFNEWILKSVPMQDGSWGVVLYTDYPTNDFVIDDTEINVIVEMSIPTQDTFGNYSNVRPDKITVDGKVYYGDHSATYKELT